MTIHHGDCLEVMRTIPDGSVDLIMTSPVYAEQRKQQGMYVPEDEYVDWWMERAAEMKRVLKEDGNMVVNIKEHVKDGQSATYVYDLVLAMVRRGGWIWPQDIPWIKTNTNPGSHHGLLRNAWEHCYVFRLVRRPKWYVEAVQRPAAPSTVKRLARLSAKDRRKRHSNSGSPLTYNLESVAESMTKAAGPNKKPVLVANPPNYIMGSASTTNKGHPAAFPDYLPEFFIQLMTVKGDTVLDPFCGSGTTIHVAERLGRVGVGIEIDKRWIPNTMEAYAE